MGHLKEGILMSDSTIAFLLVLGFIIFFYILFRVVRRYLVLPLDNEGRPLAWYVLHFKRVLRPDLNQIPEINQRIKIWKKLKDGYVIQISFGGSELKSLLKESLGYTNKEVIVTTGFRNQTFH